MGLKKKVPYTYILVARCKSLNKLLQEMRGGWRFQGNKVCCERHLKGSFKVIFLGQKTGLLLYTNAEPKTSSQKLLQEDILHLCMKKEIKNTGHLNNT